MFIIEVLLLGVAKLLERFVNLRFRLFGVFRNAWWNFAAINRV